MSNFECGAELASEREYVALLYDKLDGERAAAQLGLDGALRDATATSPYARWQRQVAVDSLTARVRGLQVADHGLCFGRIDYRDGPTTYIGRIGLLDEVQDYAPLLLDWRAPAARASYTATAAHPEGVVRRRPFQTRGRAVTGLHDDVLDLDAAAGERGTDAALLARCERRVRGGCVTSWPPSRSSKMRSSGWGQRDRGNRGWSGKRARPRSRCTGSLWAAG